ncbi:MAG: hypothetical protein ACK5QC_07635 [Bacteroidota bacterium]
MEYQIKLTDKFFKKNELFFFEVVKNGESLKYGDYVSNILSYPTLISLPEYLKNFINELDYDISEYSSIMFGEDRNDEGEIVIPKNMVGFSIFEDRTLISKSEFYNLCLQMANIALEAAEMFNLKNRNIVDDNWIGSIKDLVPKIEEKIKNYEI